MARRTRKSFDHSPMLVFYELTRACDLVCQHCRACAQSLRDPAELRTAESKRMIDQLTTFPQPPMLVLTGGDPFKRADLFELVEYAVSRGLEVSITPSSTPLVTREAIARLRDAGISRMAVSVDGADAQTHDRHRGVAGSFARCLEILQDAKDLGVPTQVNTTIIPSNANQIEEMGDLFAKYGIAMWSAFFLIPVGRAEASSRLNADECEEVFARLFAQSQKQPYLVKTTEAMHFRRYMIQHRRDAVKDTGAAKVASPPPFITAGINDGKGVMFVSHTGVVHPAGFLPVVCGTFPAQNVVDIYQKSNVFRSLRDSERLEGKCGQCEFRQICGGSRARAYAVTGNMFAAEPDCSYIPKPAKGAQKCDVV
ncbi:MAG: TIGR04053 family radical SAM/SPASM domain-containing protein [Rhodopirellula sp. JB044]|uniref:TIGR04053 family radical SAM/SPASM domain-containing protein n=1 Tax=Rhodopirellula sp. JB044 TaxID=3342844 RepID=UPI00370B4BA1